MAQEPAPRIALTFAPEFDAVRSDAEVSLTFNLHLQAPEMREEVAEGAGRSVVSLSSVLDKSGSMSGQKLDLVKRASFFMVAQLGSRDKLGVIEYDSEVHELIPLSRASAAFKTESKRMIASIEAGSCTNLSGGLFQGMQQQINNTYVDWDSGRAPDPAPTAPSLPPSDTSSVVFVDDESDFSDADSNVVHDSNVMHAELSRNNAPSPTTGLSHSAPSPTTPPQGVVAGLASLFGSMTRRRQSHRNASPARGNASPPLGVLAAPLFPGLSPSTLLNRGGRCPGYRGGGQRPKSPVPALFFGGLEAPAKHGVEEDAVRSVFLFTDGQANEGITDETKLVSMVREMADQKHRVRLYTFGFGADHSEELLSKLAEAGSGSYYFIEKEDNIATAFADALGGLLSVVAQTVKLTFVPAPGVVVDEVHTSFGTSEEGGGRRSVRIGDLLSEEAKDTLLDVRLPALADLAECQTVHFKIGHVDLSYLDVETASIKSLHVDCIVRRSRQVAAAPSNRSVSTQRARIDMVRVLEQSRAHADAGQWSASRECLAACDERLEALVESARAANDVESAALAQVLRNDVTQARANTSTEEVWRSQGKKQMQMKISSRSHQRCVRADSDEEEDLLQAASDNFRGMPPSARASGAQQAEPYAGIGLSESNAGALRSVSQFRSGTKMQQKMRSMSKSCR